MVPEESDAMKRPWLPDLVAGLSVAGLLVPEAVAYSGLAALTPEHGLYALLAGLIFYGMVGRSRFAIVSATSSSAAVLAAATASLAVGRPELRMEVAAGLVLLTGVFFLAAGAARLGAISHFIAKPVLRGFAFGLALVIIVKQLPKIVGVPGDHANILTQAFELAVQFARWNPASVGVGVVTLTLLFLLKPYQRVPSSLLVIVLGIVSQAVLGLDRHGVPLVGHIDVSFAHPSLPSLTEGVWARVGELAFAMVFVLYAESYSSVRTFALKHGDPMVPNRELAALGLANLMSGLFGGMPVGAGYSATAANEAAGATSRRSAWVAAVVVGLVLVTLLPFVALTPEPILAGIVIYAVSHTLNPAVLQPYFVWRRDRLVAIFAIAAVLLLGVLDGLLAAVGASLLMTLRDLSVSRVSVLGRFGKGHDFVDVKAHPDAVPVPGVLILRPEAPLFFANAERILFVVHECIETAGADGVKTVILSLEESPDLDSSGIEALKELAEYTSARGIGLLLARLHDPAIGVLVRVAIPQLPRSAITHWSVDDAVAEALGHGS